MMRSSGTLSATFNHFLDEDKFMRYVFHQDETIRYRYPTHVNDLLYGREEATATETFIVVLEPGEAPPLHVHPDVEQVFFVMEGSGVLTVGKGDEAQTFRLNPGDTARVPPQTYHSVRNDGDANMRYVSVDAFAGPRLDDEPTWDSHAEALCNAQGWDFAKVKLVKQGK
jgi:mannose-6-phosphate isomerase-like protein (cupin superfamily)